VTVIVEPLSPVSVSNDTLICAGDSILLTANGGTAYSWSPSAGLSATNVSNPMASPGSTTLYTVVISDTIGCHATKKVKVSVSTPGIISSSFNLSADTICENENIIVTFNGVSSPYTTFNWNFNGAIVTYGSGTGPYIIHWNGTGTYNISLQVSEFLCDSSTTLKTVTVNPIPIVSAGLDDTICKDQSTTLSATGGMSYSWWPAMSLSNSGISNPVATPSVTTTYTVTAYALGCSAQDQVRIKVWPLPNASAGPDKSICIGDSVILMATGGTTYAWSPATGLNAANIPDPVANPSLTTIYTVSVTDTNGCSALDQVQVTVYEIPTSGFSVNQMQMCVENTLTIAYTGNGSPMANYNWDFNGASIISGSGQGPYVIRWLLPGNYTISLNVNENNCYSSENTVNITVDEVTATISNYQNIPCYGDNNGTATVSATGGNLPYSYSWSNLQTGATITNLDPGNYFVTVTDINGCKSYSDVTITEPDAPLSLVTTLHNISCEYLCDGGISTVVSGGSVPYSYLWNTTPLQTDPGITGLCSGNYRVTITDDHGCKFVDQIHLPYNTAVNSSCMADDTLGSVPLGVNFTFTGYGASYTLWDFGDNSSSTLTNPSHIYTSPGAYQVTLIINSLSPDFCTDTTMLFIYAEDTSFLSFPNVITPNKDGKNDYFEITSHYLDKCSITIFNRWGSVVYESDDITFHWYGTNNTGMDVPEGTYYFVLKAKGKDRISYYRKGIITLLR